MSPYKSIDAFLALVRLGIGHSLEVSIDYLDWRSLKALAERHGLSAIVLDGIDRVQEFNGLRVQETMPQMLRLEWIGEVLQNYEARCKQYEKAISSLAGWYNQHGFKMMVLKGYACSLDWPNPKHRPCGDIDIWQFGKQKEADETIEKEKKIKVDNSHHHHTVFEWQDFTVENHYDFINVHHQKSNKELERIFKVLGEDDGHSIELKGEMIYLPSPNLHALFLMKHLSSHFSTTEATLRQVLDWAFFVEKHVKEIDWQWLESVLESFGMKPFYILVNAICVDDLGFDVGLFPKIQFDPFLKERVLKDVVLPEFTECQPKFFVGRVLFKYRRWKANGWKHKLCYKESMWCSFWSGVWNHLMKPSSI